MLHPSRWIVGLSIAALAAVGCATTQDDDLAGTGSAEDELQLESIEVLGPIAHNETKSGSYQGGAKHRAFDFQARGGDELKIGLTLNPGGDARGFITDAQNNVLASNEAEEAVGFDTTLKFRVPPGPRRAFRFSFRDGERTDASFKVKLLTCSIADEPFRRYLAAPEQCDKIVFDCLANETPFSNLCGCGCERPH